MAARLAVAKARAGGLGRRTGLVIGADQIAEIEEAADHGLLARVVPDRLARLDPGVDRPQAMPFPILIVVIAGTAEGRVDGELVTAPAGHAVFVPPHAPHQWWNELEEPAEAILIMFGEGA